MRRARTLSAFTIEEVQKAHELLATRVAFMMGRKFEEGDWAYVYSEAKGFPNSGWSNLNIDVIHNGVGVEHKMIRPNNKSVLDTFGMPLMHPSATRSIRISQGDPNEVMRDVLTQYGELLEGRKRQVKERYPNLEPDMRTGWLLWQSNLKDFVYFEEETLIPDPSDYIAEWHEKPQAGGRKSSQSLWIFERETGHKRYSVTTTAGAKIQPYFDVPPSSDPNVYRFRVQGEEIKPGLIRLWLPVSTARELESLVGNLNTQDLQIFIHKSLSEPTTENDQTTYKTEHVKPIVLTTESYQLLEATYANAKSDAHMIQLLLAKHSQQIG